MKKCPYCAEMIQEEAVKCRFCGSRVTGRDTGSPAPRRGGVGLGVTALVLGILSFLGAIAAGADPSAGVDEVLGILTFGLGAVTLGVIVTARRDQAWGMGLAGAISGGLVALDIIVAMIGGGS